VFDVQQPVDTAAGEKAIWGLAEEHLPPGRAGDYNQALMDLGATTCLPRNPKCAECPVKGICKAYTLRIQQERPVFKPKNHIPHHTVAAAVIRKNGRVLIAQRPQAGLLGGMWEFPGGKQENGEALEACLRREIREELGVQIKVGNELGVFRHAYTHFRVTLHAFACTLPAGKPRAIIPDGLKWVKPDNLEDYPMGKLDREISQTLANKR
jgi:A/G-specific adenine glycosylase